MWIVVTQFLTHLFIDKVFGKSKNSENNKNPKKYVFNIFAVFFLAFSTLSKNEF